MPRGSARLPSVDGLRAVSIAFVLLGHLAQFRDAASNSFSISPLANFGVRVFFVISGFLITFLFLNEYAKTGTISLFGFYARRALRILPAFWAYAAVVWILFRCGIVAVHHNDFFAALAFWMNYHAGRSWILGHIWSLSVEEQFYMIWPVVLVIAGFAAAKRMLIGVVLASPFLRLAVYFALPNYRVYIGETFFTLADSLAIGCLLAAKRDELWTYEWYRKLLSSKLFVLVPAAAIACNYSHSSIAFDGLLLSYMHVAIALTIDWCIRNADHAAARWLNLRPIVLLGVCSYSAYLWQELFLDPVDPIFPRWFIWFRIPATIVVAYLSYRVIELPFLALKKRFMPVQSAEKSSAIAEAAIP